MMKELLNRFIFPDIQRALNNYRQSESANADRESKELLLPEAVKYRLFHKQQLRNTAQLVLILLSAISVIKSQEVNNYSGVREPFKYFDAFNAVIPSNFQSGFDITKRDLAETVSYFQTKDASKSVYRFKNRMPKPVLEWKFRQAVYENLPSVIKKLQLKDPKIINQFKKVISPVLWFYEREKIYDVVIVQTNRPIIFVDSGVALVISTGLITEAQSDDEVLGLIAHEIGHEYFVEYSFYTKQILKSIEEGNKEPSLKRKYTEALALIELHCDAFAALTLTYLKYKPLAFIEAIQRFENEYQSTNSENIHPAVNIRYKLIEDILPRRWNKDGKNQISKNLSTLKKMITNSSSSLSK